MRSYEGMFVFPPESGPEARDKEWKFIEETMKKCQGTIVNKLEWGKRTLGYPVKKFREGFFIVVNFQMAPSKIDEFRRALELDEQLVKYVVTIEPPKAKVKEPKPAAAAPKAVSPAVPAQQ